MEVSNLLDKRNQKIVINILIELRKRIEEHSENSNKELENIRKNQSEKGNMQKGE